MLQQAIQQSLAIQEAEEEARRAAQVPIEEEKEEASMIDKPDQSASDKNIDKNSQTSRAGQDASAIGEQVAEETQRALT